MRSSFRLLAMLSSCNSSRAACRSLSSVSARSPKATAMDRAASSSALRRAPLSRSACKAAASCCRRASDRATDSAAASSSAVCWALLASAWPCSRSNRCVTSASLRRPSCSRASASRSRCSSVAQRCRSSCEPRRARAEVAHRGRAVPAGPHLVLTHPPQLLLHGQRARRKLAGPAIGAGPRGLELARGQIADGRGPGHLCPVQRRDLAGTGCKRG